MTHKFIKVALILTYWILSTVFTASGIFADDCNYFRALNSEYQIRSEVGFAIAWSAMPFTIVIGPLMTGGYYYGI